MVFSSPIFLFLFLPLMLAGYYLLAGMFQSARNVFLFTASLFFYAWGEKTYLFVLLGSLIVNYILARMLERYRSRGLLAWAITLNLSLLVVFKYKAFLVANLSGVWELFGGSAFSVKEGHLPIGISFFTFQAMSYVIDVHRREVPAQRSFLLFGLYVFLFPHLIAGPIVRYRDIADQLAKRRISGEQFALGVKRFILGLAKKMLFANTLAEIADQIFKLPADQLTLGAAWLGIVCYTLQIYFDFSGYSDMAIGLGKMFGFDFLENFRYPYMATSITDFWRRWHISLSSWFRDYLYIPLGGNRGSRLRTYTNLMIVFLLCGLWHGASWTFIVWGAFHGLFLIVERLGLNSALDRAWRPLQHFYVLVAVMVGWVFFRVETIAHGFTYLSAMSGMTSGIYLASDFWTLELAWVLPFAILAATPVRPWIEAQLTKLPQLEGVGSLVETLGLGVLFFVSTVMLAAGTYSPFIYFRF